MQISETVLPTLSLSRQELREGIFFAAEEKTGSTSIQADSVSAYQAADKIGAAAGLARLITRNRLGSWR
jgi:hypothetical protein